MSSVLSAVFGAAAQAASSVRSMAPGRAKEEGGGEFGSMLAGALGGKKEAPSTEATERAESVEQSAPPTGETAEAAASGAGTPPVTAETPVAAEGGAEAAAGADVPAAEETQGRSGEAAGLAEAIASNTGSNPVTAEITAAAEGGVEAAAGAAAAGVAGPNDPKQVERAMQRLDPEFRTRLERVIGRMRAEHGHEVKLVETTRSQVRQDFLFEQGRSRPGPVVTWTRSSNHTLGRAADVLIDGTYNNPAGYAKLAQIASEEGLRTLGSKDPGHVELPRGARPIPSLAGPLQPVAPQTVTAGGQGGVQGAADAVVAERAGAVAQVAELARVADVARVSQVAQVAQVAQPGRVAATAAATLRGGQDGARQEGSGRGDSAGRPADAELMRLESVPLFGQISSPSSVEALGATGGVDAASRLARIMEVRENAAAGPMNHVLLRVENGTGGEDLIRVDLRGNTVGASIDLANRGEVDQLLARLPELQRALKQHGLETEQLRVRSANAALGDAAELVRTAAAGEVETARGGNGSRSNSSSDSAERDRRENEAEGQSRRDTEDPRRQFRRNPKGEDKA